MNDEDLGALSDLLSDDVDHLAPGGLLWPPVDGQLPPMWVPALPDAAPPPAPADATAAATRQILADVAAAILSRFAPAPVAPPEVCAPASHDRPTAASDPSAAAAAPPRRRGRPAAVIDHGDGVPSAGVPMGRATQARAYRQRVKDREAAAAEKLAALESTLARAPEVEAANARLRALAGTLTGWGVSPSQHSTGPVWGGAADAAAIAAAAITAAEAAHASWASRAIKARAVATTALRHAASSAPPEPCSCRPEIAAAAAAAAAAHMEALRAAHASSAASAVAAVLDAGNSTAGPCCNASASAVAALQDDPAGGGDRGYGGAWASLVAAASGLQPALSPTQAAGVGRLRAAHGRLLAAIHAERGVLAAATKGWLSRLPPSMTAARDSDATSAPDGAKGGVVVPDYPHVVGTCACSVSPPRDDVAASWAGVLGGAALASSLERLESNLSEEMLTGAELGLGLLSHLHPLQSLQLAPAQCPQLPSPWAVLESLAAAEARGVAYGAAEAEFERRACAMFGPPGVPTGEFEAEPVLLLA